jgi:hypothetical protein
LASFIELELAGAKHVACLQSFNKIKYLKYGYNIAAARNVKPTKLISSALSSMAIEEEFLSELVFRTTCA